MNRAAMFSRRTGGGDNQPPATTPVQLSELAIEQLLELATGALGGYVQDGVHRDHLERGQRALAETLLRLQRAALARDIARFERS